MPEPRTVLVTGGSRGIGLGIAQALVVAGFRVVAIARRQSDALQAAQGACGPALSFHAADLEDLGAIHGVVQDIRAVFGPVYGLVNNAGIGTSGVLATMPDAAIERLIRLNVASPILLTKYAMRGMMAAGAGRVVMLSSIVAGTGYPGLSVYSASKASLHGFARSLAREVGGLGITVNVVAPGFIDTDMTSELDAGHRTQIARRSALKRMPEVSDVAAAVGYLFTDGARNVTGTVLTVDAGNTA